MSSALTRVFRLSTAANQSSSSPLCWFLEVSVRASSVWPEPFSVTGADPAWLTVEGGLLSEKGDSDGAFLLSAPESQSSLASSLKLLFEDSLLVLLMTSLVMTEGSVASADVMTVSAGEGLLSNRGVSDGLLVFAAPAARKSSSDLRPNQSDALRSLDEEVGLGFFSGKAKSGSSEENLIQRTTFHVVFLKNTNFLE